jgi:hypothetical protein
MYIIGRTEFLSEAGTECAVVHSAANLEQKIGPSPRPARLLRPVRPAVHQKIGDPSGNRTPKPAWSRFGAGAQDAIVFIPFDAGYRHSTQGGRACTEIESDGVFGRAARHPERWWVLRLRLMVDVGCVETATSIRWRSAA